MGKSVSESNTKLKKFSVNRVMLAAPKSGSGKTLITCALLEALKRRGLDPVSFKCGPDYIDPMFHKKVLGIDNKNLDTYFAGAEGVKNILSKYEGRNVVIEGVMGLYDGLNVENLEGSSYEIASITGTPIVLIVDASSAGRTVISTIKGILLDDRHGLIKGIILNKISENFYKTLAPVMISELAESSFDARLLGFVPKAKDINLESRHLGLKLPGEIGDLREQISKAADLLEANVDIDGLLEIMMGARKLCASGSSKNDGSRVMSTNLTLAVAYDDAFCFYYKENLEMFERRGVKIAYFSPLHDKELPADADGILLGGGYPELHLDELQSNKSMLASIRTAIASGIPSLAECGGFMYLFDVGAIDGSCSDTGKLVRFGYMELESCAETEGYYAKAAGLKGHEFHYFDSTNNGEACVAKKPNKDTKWNCMIANNNGFWGFPHFYYGSKPEFVDAFIDKMKEVADGKLK
ncbi:MAG: cobyrinate a,c-diamide synthase [Lachnospiraceae bacterium]|nr:cobyrinate a,c-diamide synthase [Lachnospiraceae bacterium]